MALTTLFDPSLNTDIESFNFLEYQQLPTSPIYLIPSDKPLAKYALVAQPTKVKEMAKALPVDGVPNLFEGATKNDKGTTLNTNGAIFAELGIFAVTSFDPFDPLNAKYINSFDADANTGYAGFTNYTIAGLDDITFADLQEGKVDVEALLESPQVTATEGNLPALDPETGFTLSFELAIAEEESNVNRAGFSLVLVTNDPTKEIELGFTDRDGSDRIFAQSQDFTEAEDTTGKTLDFSKLQTYDLAVKDSKYVLSVDGVNVLSGDLRNYNFDPATSDPPLPASPYDLKNLIFLGDNTDQAYAEFTLGKISLALPEAPKESSSSSSDVVTSVSPSDVVTSVSTVPTAAEATFSFEQWVLFTGKSYKSTLVSFDIEFGGLELAPLFDEAQYLNDNPDVAAAVQQGSFSYGFEHFVLFGINEGRSPGKWFDEDYYLAQNDDVAAAVKGGKMPNALFHFLVFGHREKRNPNKFFDADDYLLSNPDVNAAVEDGAFDSPFEHYGKFGGKEGRQVGLLFQEAFYLKHNPDVAKAVEAGVFAQGLDHFLIFGQKEGRNPSSLFDQSAYLENYEDVAAAVSSGAFESGFQHYVLFGRAEGRVTV